MIICQTRRPTEVFQLSCHCQLMDISDFVSRYTEQDTPLDPLITSLIFQSLRTDAAGPSYLKPYKPAPYHPSVNIPSVSGTWVKIELRIVRGNDPVIRDLVFRNRNMTVPK